MKANSTQSLVHFKEIFSISWQHKKKKKKYVQSLIDMRQTILLTIYAIYCFAVTKSKLYENTNKNKYSQMAQNEYIHTFFLQFENVFMF